MSGDNDKMVIHEENVAMIDIRRKLMQETSILQKDLETKRQQLIDVENILRERCNHQWVVDYIDQMYPTFKEGIRIEYCRRCELNRYKTI